MTHIGRGRVYLDRSDSSHLQCCEDSERTHNLTCKYHQTVVRLSQLPSRLRLLALVAAASAYPHHFYNPYYGLPLVPGPYHPIAPLPQPAPLARAGYQETYLQDEQTARYLINFEAFQRVQGVFQTDGAMKTVTGSASFYQNPFTGTNSKYRIDLTGITAGTAYWLALTDDCSAITTIKVRHREMINMSR